MLEEGWHQVMIMFLFLVPTVIKVLLLQRNLLGHYYLKSQSYKEQNMNLKASNIDLGWRNCQTT